MSICTWLPLGYGSLQPSRAPGSQGKVTLCWEKVLLLGGWCEGPWVRKEQVSALLSLFILKYDHWFFPWPEKVWREKRGRRKLLCSHCSKPGIAHYQFISEEAWPVHKVTWLFTVENELWLQEAKGKECTEYVPILPGSLHQCLLAASVWYEKLKHWVSIETNILSV